MNIVFVSGCYDVLHAGHIDFFNAVRQRFEPCRLIVSVASDEVYLRHKGRLASQPDSSKLDLLLSVRMVDEVYLGMGPKLGLDFERDFIATAKQIRAGQHLILVVTEDDRYGDIKRALCKKWKADYVMLKDVKQRPVSTTDVITRIRAPLQCPLRVDFGGGWLDVPRHASAGGYIVNCAITPPVSLSDWPYQEKCGLGGSAAWALLQGKNPVESELRNGAGWQDPAVIMETGLCVWRSGPAPRLEFKTDGAFLNGLMAIAWTGKRNLVVNIAGKVRDYERIRAAGELARSAALGSLSSLSIEHTSHLQCLMGALNLSYAGQLLEGMKKLKPVRGALAWKYCGGGFGGYALYLFDSRRARDRACQRPEFTPIEPYCR